MSLQSASVANERLSLCVMLVCVILTFLEEEEKSLLGLCVSSLCSLKKNKSLSVMLVCVILMFCKEKEEK